MDEHPTTGRSPCHVDLAEIVFISKTSEISTQLKHPHSSEEGLSAKMNIQPTVTCSQCNKFLAVMTEESIAPSCEELLAAGASQAAILGWYRHILAIQGWVCTGQQFAPIVISIKYAVKLQMDREVTITAV